MSARSHYSETPAPFFQAPHHRLQLLDLWQRFDDMLMFYTVAAALLLSMAIIPAYAMTIDPAGGSGRAVEVSAAKSGPISDDPISRACSGQAWASETIECLRAIAEAGGKDVSSDIRIIAAGEPDTTRPNIF